MRLESIIKTMPAAAQPEMLGMAQAAMSERFSSYFTDPTLQRPGYVQDIGRAMAPMIGQDMTNFLD